jgi:hypothetical protein
VTTAAARFILCERWWKHRVLHRVARSMLRCLSEADDKLVALSLDPTTL